MSKYETAGAIDVDGALSTIWDALHAYQETCINESTEENEAEWEDICEAMEAIRVAINEEASS